MPIFTSRQHGSVGLNLSFVTASVEISGELSWGNKPRSAVLGSSQDTDGMRALKQAMLSCAGAELPHRISVLPVFFSSLSQIYAKLHSHTSSRLAL